MVRPDCYNISLARFRSHLPGLVSNTYHSFEAYPELHCSLLSSSVNMPYVFTQNAYKPGLFGGTN